MACVHCRLGRIWECRVQGNCNSNSGSGSPVSSRSEGILDIPGDEEGTAGPVREINTYKNDASLKDQQSTGRKRAAEMYPLARDEACEWKMQTNCGGGKSPITGCADGKQEARHHGPDKNTLNNDYGNVHRICHVCHNRWHARNDEGYIWGAVLNPHSPTVANESDIMRSELSWLGKKLTKVTD